MKHKPAKLPSCSNCGFRFGEADSYCPRCGQKNHETKVPLKHLLEEFVESTFHLDTKILKTLRYLIFFPGRLSREYNEGKRARFVSPLRLYIFISFLFFLLLNIYTPKNANTAEGIRDGKRAAINFSVAGIYAQELAGLTEAQKDALLAERRIKPTVINTFLISQLYKMANGGMGEFVHGFIKNTSTMMFVLMPGFALIIFLFFRKRTKYFIESLVLSLHFHGFTFLLMSVFILLGLVKTILFVLLTPFVMLAYLFLALRHYYGQGAPVILFKTAAIGAFYIVQFLVLFLGTMLVSVAVL